MSKIPLKLILYLTALDAFAGFATDTYLPAMPIIQQQFATSSTHIQLTLSTFFLAFAFAQLVWGPLSDRIGRKTVIFLGTLLFIIGSLLCAWSQGIGLLITARIIQAIGSCCGTVAAISVVKILFPNTKQMAKALSWIMSVSIIVPMIAPIIGSYLLVHFHWQANFYFLASYATLVLLGTCFIKESHPAATRKPLPANRLVHAHIEQLKSVPFLLAVFAASTNFSAVFSFISASPSVYIKIYSLPVHLFGYFFAMNASGLILGSLSLNILKKRLHSTRIIALAISVCIIGALSMLITLSQHTHTIWSIAIPAFIATYGSGMLFPELMTQALSHVIHYNGIASALAGTIRFTLASSIALLIGILIKHSALPLPMVMLALNVLTAVSIFSYFRSRSSIQ